MNHICQNVTEWLMFVCTMISRVVRACTVLFVGLLDICNTATVLRAFRVFILFIRVIYMRTLTVSYDLEYTEATKFQRHSSRTNVILLYRESDSQLIRISHPLERNFFPLTPTTLPSLSHSFS